MVSTDNSARTAQQIRHICSICGTFWETSVGKRWSVVPEPSLGIHGLMFAGLAIWVVMKPKMKEVRPYAPSIIPVISPFCSGNHSQLQNSGIQKHRPMPAGNPISYMTTNVHQDLVWDAMKIHVTINMEPSKMIHLGLYLFYIYPPIGFMRLYIVQLSGIHRTARLSVASLSPIWWK